MGSFLTPGTRLAACIKRTTIHCYTQNIKALGLIACGFEGFFSHDAPIVWPVWTPGAQLAGFIKITIIHCFTQNRRALGLVVSEKISHDTSREGPVLTPGAGYTLLHTKYESPGPCDFREEDFFYMFFSDCKSMGANTPGAGSFMTPGA